METEYLLVLGLIILLIEVILSGRWSKFYFNFGIPLFSKEISFPRNKIEVLSVTESLNKKFKGSAFSQSMVFNSLDNSTIAFREKMLEF